MDRDELTKILAERGSPWRANEGGIPSARNKWLAGVPEFSVAEALRAASSNLQPPRSSKARAPERFDWRSHGDVDVLGAVKDQSTCRSCAAFAVCSVVEARLRLQGEGDSSIDLSEADLFFCGGGLVETGMSVEAALSRARHHGIGREHDHPYDPSATGCLQVAPAARVTGFQYVVEPKERRLSICEDGPVVGIMQVFEDFIDYSGGIYENVAGAYEGLHAVSIVGYDDALQCWIARNSWGPDAGEEGYFRIRYGECQIDTRPFYALDVEQIP